MRKEKAGPRSGGVSQGRGLTGLKAAQSESGAKFRGGAAWLPIFIIFRNNFLENYL
jgi:hypothetical protein